MANRHFAKLADVWKHLPLTEILAIEQPRRYWESHAGSAAYAMASDPERRYGATTFFAVAPKSPELASSRSLRHLRALNPTGPLDVYPGSALLAMCERRTTCAYTLCEVDAASARDLADWSLRLQVDTTIVESDGNGALCAALDGAGDARTLVVHVDPYDPWSAEPGGVNALDLAAAAAERGAKLVYWYGYSDPAQRAWAFDELAGRVGDERLWCGDVMVQSCGEPAVRHDGDLGDATTPGTGFGTVTANVSPQAVAACRVLGVALGAAYEGVPLPDGDAGRLDFATRGSAGGAC